MNATNAQSPGTEAAPRSVEKVMEIKAPVEAVWKALTEADELTRWFPLQAKATPGVGGKIWVSWGAPIEGESEIQIWEPNRRLKTTWPFAEGHGTMGGVVLTVDYLLEAKGGTTTLRLVHSGFGHGADWDTQYDSVRQGWDFELRGMRHYLENHLGTPRRVIWSRRPVKTSVEATWQVVLGSKGLGALAAIQGAKSGAAYAFTSPEGTHYEGKLDLFNPPKQFSATVAGLNNAYLLIQAEACGGAPEVWMWMNTYGVAEEVCRRVQGEWDGMLARLLT
ncbi:MAG: SRPBCC domain-containing protein [Planctomycetota bacterium]